VLPAVARDASAAVAEPAAGDARDGRGEVGGGVEGEAELDGAVVPVLGREELRGAEDQQCRGDVAELEGGDADEEASESSVQDGPDADAQRSPLLLGGPAGGTDGVARGRGHADQRGEDGGGGVAPEGGAAAALGVVGERPAAEACEARATIGDTLDQPERGRMPDEAACQAGAEGLEPPAYGFGDRRSTN
jgi:hypothetical protein